MHTVCECTTIAARPWRHLDAGSSNRVIFSLVTQSLGDALGVDET